MLHKTTFFPKNETYILKPGTSGLCITIFEAKIVMSLATLQDDWQA